MKLVIAGKNSIAVDVLEYAIKILKLKVFVVLNKTENYSNGFQKSLGFYSRLWNVPIVSLEDIYEFENTVFLSLEFDRIIKPNLFKSKKLFNIHFSLLPKYKGVYTSAWPILNGDEKSGVTLHVIDDGIDTGEIITQSDFKINKFESARSLYLKYIKYGTKLIIENLKNLLTGQYNSIPQDEINSSYYGKRSIDYANLKINYCEKSYMIDRQLRAFSFREYQLPIFNQYEIKKCEITYNKSKSKPGSMVNKSGCKIQIATVDYDMNLWVDNYKEILEYCRLNKFDLLRDNLDIKDLKIKTK